MDKSTSNNPEKKRRIEQTPTETLKPHEKIIDQRLESLMGTIRTDGHLKLPILVDDETDVILDGHHRFEILQQLGTARIPCLRIDYLNDADLDLAKGPNCPVNELSRSKVLDKGESDSLFPPKSTRHRVKFTYPEINVPLEELR